METLLAQWRRITGNTAYIVPCVCGRRRDRDPSTVRAFPQALRDQRCLNLPHFTPYDLRRTAASPMTATRVRRMHVETVMNNEIDDVAQIYDRHDYAAEKIAAFRASSHAILRILTSAPSPTSCRLARNGAACARLAESPRRKSAELAEADGLATRKLHRAASCTLRARRNKVVPADLIWRSAMKLKRYELDPTVEPLECFRDHP